jgi:hypothetical protein
MRIDMTLELYQEVALTRDLPEYQLRAGDTALPDVMRYNKIN